MCDVGLIYYDDLTRRQDSLQTNDRHHLVGLFASSATIGEHKSFVSYARLC